MPLKRRRSSAADHHGQKSKRVRTRHPLDYLSDLSDELLIRILHNLPIQTLLQCQRLSHRFYTLAGDSQVWKNLYYNRFVLPRALRIPGIKAAPPEVALHFSSRRSKWLDENALVNRVDGKKTNWKRQYKLRHNWSIGACEVQEIHVADRPSVPSMMVRLAEGVIVTADKDEGLRAWDLKEKVLVAEHKLEEEDVPSCLAVDEQEAGGGSLGIAIGFLGGGWETWKLDIGRKMFIRQHKHPSSSNGSLGAVAYAKPYILTITESQLLSLYSFIPPKPKMDKPEDNLAEPGSEPKMTVGKNPKPEPRSPSVTPEEVSLPSLTTTSHRSQMSHRQILLPETTNTPHLLASLTSHTTWPPLSLSIRATPTSVIASIAYTLPTYLSGYTIGLQELHLSLSTSTIVLSRLTSALPQGFSSILPPSPSSSPSSSSPSPGPALERNLGIQSTRPTSLSYSHPYILATHPDNTLTLYLCTSTASSLSITPGTKLWGHTSSVSSAEITPRGKAVSVSTRGNELRVWELEGGKKRKRVGAEGSVRIKGQGSNKLTNIDLATGGGEGNNGGNLEHERRGADWDERKNWVGFDDECVIVLKESGSGGQALVVYDFT